MSPMKIGQVAALAGVGVDIVRYYERLGLLPPPPDVFKGDIVGLGWEDS